MLEAMWMKGSLRLAGPVAGARGRLLAASCPPFPSPPHRDTPPVALRTLGTIRGSFLQEKRRKRSGISHTR